MNTNAQTRYAELEAEVNIQLHRIAFALKAHTATERVTWAHAGDLGHLVELLTDAANFMADEE